MRNNSSRLLLEHKEGMLTIGNVLVIDRYTESKDKTGVTLPDIAGMVDPFAVVN